METPDPNIMPEVNLGVADKLKRGMGKVVGLCTYRPPVVHDYMSEHYKGPQTAEEALETTLGEEMINGTLSAQEALEQLHEAHAYLNGYGELSDGLTVQLRLPYE